MVCLWLVLTVESLTSYYDIFNKHIPMRFSLCDTLIASCRLLGHTIMLQSCFATSQKVHTVHANI